MTAPLILLHGFSQTTASLDPLRHALADQTIATTAPELPGHGAGVGPDRLVDGDLWAGADALVDAGHHGIFFGYSMGARLALHVALAHPTEVRGLVLLGGTAGIDDADERAARRAADAALANRIEREGLSPFLESWLAMPLFATLPPDPNRLARRAANRAAGVASSLRRWGTGTMDPPLWSRLTEIVAPTLVLAGDLDTKFSDLGHRIADSVGPNAGFVRIRDAGHAAHVERPAAVAGEITRWLAENGLDPFAQ